MTDITQGPWRANLPEDARRPITIETTWRNEGAVGGVIIATVNHHGTGRGMARRNARHMAVAPELFPVLDRLLAVYAPEPGVANTSPSLPADMSTADVLALWQTLQELVKRAHEY